MTFIIVLVLGSLQKGNLEPLSGKTGWKIYLQNMKAPPIYLPAGDLHIIAVCISRRRKVYESS